MRIKRYGVLITFLTLTFAVASGVFAQIQLPAGTEMQIVFDQKISSGSAKVGDLVTFHLKDQIEVGGVVVVKVGCKGTAKVKSLEKAGKPGKPGKLEFDPVSLSPEHAYKAANGSKVLLESAGGGPILAKGSGKKILSFILGFGLLIKGGEGKVEAQTEMTVKVKQDIDLEAQ